MKATIINEQTLMIYFKNEISEDTYNQIIYTTQYIKNKNLQAINEIIPSYRAIMVTFDQHKIDIDELIQQLQLDSINYKHIDKTSNNKVVHIPVLYGSDAGPDLSEVAKYNGLTSEEVIEIHTSKQYLIYMLGFMPGFPYLGGLDSRIHMPRRSEPRVRIAAGSVGIANNQTGLYPLDSPGGWQIIGRTPIRVFNKDDQPMTLYQAGDKIKFYAIDQHTYQQIQDDIDKGCFNKEKWVTMRNGN